MKVGLNGHFLIQGCEIINYLLEKSRVVTQSTMEVRRLLCDACGCMLLL
jgi:myosin heavy subunit